VEREPIAMSQTRHQGTTLLWLAGFYVAIPTVGLILAYWFGLGWFLLMVAFRVAFSSLPGPRSFVLRRIFGDQTAADIDHGLARRRSRGISSQLAIPIVLAYFGLAMVVFWKLNFPLRALVALILGTR
jgi:hypothetical protein